MKIVMATGGSGGHIFPALAVAAELTKGNHEIIFAGSLGAAAEKIKKAGYEVKNIYARGFSLKPAWSFFTSFFFLVKATWRSFLLLRSLAPDAVVGFGGYGGFPVVWAAAQLRYPTIIHEQNVIAGRANRLLGKFVNKVALSFEESRRYFPSQKIVLTGCPCREDNLTLSRQEIFAKFNLAEDRLTILVFGGSHGSRRINEEFIKTIPLLKNDINFQVIHLTGGKDFDKLKEEYRRLDVRNYLFRFLEKMEEAYTIADVAICRAGAMTVFEIAKFQLPAILIPYPFAGAHQRENARLAVGKGLAGMIEERDLTTQRLRDEILRITRDKFSREKAAQGAKKIYFSDSAVRLAQEIRLLRSIQK